ncbi:MAG: ATP-binding cassette domain-containing protein, partial [Thermomonas sp.]
MSGGLEVDARVGDRLDVSFRCDPGDVVAVIGPNGAGKSTLVRAVAGLEPVDGRIRLDHRDLTHLPVRERHVGLVFQDQRLFPHLSALANVAFGPRSRGMGRRAAADRA